MGLFGAFKFELVEAETKTPFKEHNHAGKVYVEAEPGAEYFVSIQKLDKTETDVYVGFSVDGGTDLCCLQYTKTTVDKEPYYLGILRVENGVSTTTALEFVKPTFSESSSMNERLMMGNVVITVKEMVYTGRVIPRFNSNGSKFKAATVDLNNGGASKKKNLRSAEGSNSFSKNYGDTTYEVEVRDIVDTGKCIQRWRIDRLLVLFSRTG